MPKTTFGELTLSLDDARPSLYKLEFSGRSSARDPSLELLPYFEMLFRRVAGDALEVHFEDLAYFNSSTIAALIRIINMANTQKVRLTVLYDGKQRWQRLSFEGLKRALKPFDSENASTVRIEALP